MSSVIIENVRCFHGRSVTALRPITVLVGENSSGKSTFLACTRLAWHAAQLSFPMDFNEDPFLLGAYDQIATFRGGRGGRASSFTVGFEFPLGDWPKKMSAKALRGSAAVSARFIRRGVQPELDCWEFSCGGYGISIAGQQAGSESSATLRTPKNELAIRSLPEFPARMGLLPFVGFARFAATKRPAGEGFPRVEGAIPNPDEFDVLEQLVFRAYRQLGSKPYATAPIRTKPLRTYDPLKETPTPEGTHTPMILAKILAGNADAPSSVRAMLKEFGNSSGLMEDLSVRRMGDKESDPFQLRVKIAGPAFNLADVGYGVSQVLPIVVDALRQPRGTTFLLQQPEVHLHPRAQAALATLLCKTASEQSVNFLVETHSDYFIDRLRLSVRKGGPISASDVIILYFQREGACVRIHEIRLDEHGNVLAPPPGYRQFFLDEQRQLLDG